MFVQVTPKPDVMFRNPPLRKGLRVFVFAPREAKERHEPLANYGKRLATIMSCTTSPETTSLAH